MRTYSAALSAVAALALASCGHMPVSTMVKLRNFDFATFSPEDLRIAVRAPEWLRTRPGGAKLTATVTAPSGEKSVDVFALQPETDGKTLGGLAEYRLPGARIEAWRASEADARRIRELQAQARARTAAGAKGGTLRIDIGVDACRAGELRPGSILSTTFLRPTPQDEWMVFLRDVDLRKAAADAGRPLDEALPACAP